MTEAEKARFARRFAANVLGGVLSIPEPKTGTGSNIAPEPPPLMTTQRAVHIALALLVSLSGVYLALAPKLVLLLAGLALRRPLAVTWASWLGVHVCLGFGWYVLILCTAIKNPPPSNRSRH
ncbi:hypothetical protein [Paludisphaera mucosa]|uniref:Superinfection immunity protein n=1 Tax=Paludisphaera mucosa TaxID=3030827 RepID=A0ABT6F6Q3_9BACT|nr:hypothetical protein [Paludisphaera mucosa]MDG3003234.1 hypothetical protein [Paludisphaera mucosa]